MCGSAAFPVGSTYLIGQPKKEKSNRRRGDAEKGKMEDTRYLSERMTLFLLSPPRLRNSYSIFLYVLMSPSD